MKEHTTIAVDLSKSVEIRELEEKIRMVEHQLEALAQTLPAVGRLRTVPGIGLLSSTALIAVVGELWATRHGKATCPAGQVQRLVRRRTAERTLIWAGLRA